MGTSLTCFGVRLIRCHSYCTDVYIYKLCTGVAEVRTLFAQRNIPETLKDKYISLLEKFEVALIIKRRHVIIPSLMPDAAQYPKTTDVLQDCRLEASLSNIESYYQPPLRRFWVSNYIPDGFWPRLICRIANDHQIGKVHKLMTLRVHMYTCTCIIYYSGTCT